MLALCWRYVPHLLFLQAVLATLPATAAVNGESHSHLLEWRGHHNYHEVVEGDVAYACLPLNEFTPQYTSVMQSDISPRSDNQNQLGASGSNNNGASRSGFSDVGEYHGDSTSSARSSSGLSSSSSNNNRVQAFSLASETVAVKVTSLLDGDVNTSACSPSSQPPALCSFRSALLFCSDLLTTTISTSTSQPPNTTSCVITLPRGDEEGVGERGAVIYMDPLKGQISLTATPLSPGDTSSSTSALQGTLSVLGNGCTITANTSSSGQQASRLLHVVLPSPPAFDFHLLLDNFTIANFGDVSVEGSGLFLANLGNSTLSSMTFRSNSGSNGGAVYLDTSEDILFESCVFQHNNASIYGAGVFIYTECHRISFNDCSFISNICIEDGGKHCLLHEVVSWSCLPACLPLSLCVHRAYFMSYRVIIPCVYALIHKQ